MEGRRARSILGAVEVTAPLPIRVAPGVSALTSGILRAVLYPEDTEYTAAVERCYGKPLVELARLLLPHHYRRDDQAGILFTDCPVRTAHPLLPPCEPPEQAEGELTPPAPGEFRVCPSDHRGHPGAHLYRCQHPDLPREELLPAFPHGWWPPNDPAWEVPLPTCEVIEPGKIRIGFCGLGRRPEIRAQALAAVLEWAELQPSEVTAEIVLREKFMGRELRPERARSEYLGHMQRNLYQICVRGVGDYCYRLYEALSWGRVPVIVGERSLPWSDSIDWSEHAVLVPRPELIRERVLDWHRRKYSAESIRGLCAANRTLWLVHLSPVGWWASAGELIRERMGRV
jgi:hypothetical protein